MLRGAVYGGVENSGFFRVIMVDSGMFAPDGELLSVVRTKVSGWDLGPYPTQQHCLELREGGGDKPKNLLISTLSFDSR